MTERTEPLTKEEIKSYIYSDKPIQPTELQFLRMLICKDINTHFQRSKIHNELLDAFGLTEEEVEGTWLGK